MKECTVIINFQENRIRWMFPVLDEHLLAGLTGRTRYSLMRATPAVDIEKQLSSLHLVVGI